eukprot:scaffold36947_cov20-Tisochrysis_lutea.AAC.1
MGRTKIKEQCKLIKGPLIRTSTGTMLASASRGRPSQILAPCTLAQHGPSLCHARTNIHTYTHAHTCTTHTLTHMHFHTHTHMHSLTCHPDSDHLAGRRALLAEASLQGAAGKCNISSAVHAMIMSSGVVRET